MGVGAATLAGPPDNSAKSSVALATPGQTLPDGLDEGRRKERPHQAVGGTGHRHHATFGQRCFGGTDDVLGFEPHPSWNPARKVLEASSSMEICPHITRANGNHARTFVPNFEIEAPCVGRCKGL